jgi:hypothetical protein
MVNNNNVKEFEVADGVWHSRPVSSPERLIGKLQRAWTADQMLRIFRLGDRHPCLVYQHDNRFEY